MAPRAARSSGRPTDCFSAIVSYIPFGVANMDKTWVGAMQVIPWPGGFDGGWVTPNLDGKIKGAPGTRRR